MRSYISTTCVLQLDRDPEPLVPEIIIHTPLGVSMIRDTVYRDYEISMQGVPMPTDLIPLEISDFDMILGMDWLHQH